MKKAKKILSLLLAVVMMFGALPNTVFALEDSYVAKIGDDGFATLKEAVDSAALANMEHIVVDLCADAVYDVAAWDQNSLGGNDTKTITINGNGHKLTFNNTNSDWNNVVTKNDAKLILNNMTIDNSGHDCDKGTWNAYDINFACHVTMNNVTALNALAFKNGANLQNVKVIDNGLSAAYAIWICANGQSVTLNNCEIDSTANTDGRGIKIDEQYLDSGEKGKVTLSVSNTKFATDSKPAILIKSTEGADVSINNVDISKVSADTVNAVWVDEDSASYADKVSVTGASMIVEGQPIPSKLTTNIDDLEFIVSVPQEFTFSTKANDDAGVMVVGLSNFNDPDAIDKLEYYEQANGQWYELVGEFGPSTGFPMADATSKFRVTFAKSGEFKFTANMKKVDGGETLCSVEATANVRDYKPAELKTNIGELEFVVGVPQEFTFSTVANDDAGKMVVGLSNFNDPDAIEKLEYYEPASEKWFDLNGAFGGGNGFPMANATSNFRVTFAKAGEFKFKSEMITVDGDVVLCDVETTANVVEPIIEFVVNDQTEANANGSLEMAEKIEKGKNLEIEIKANDGYELDKLIVDDVDVTAGVEDNKYVVENVQKDVYVKATFKEIESGGEEPVEKIVIKSAKLEWDVPELGKPMSDLKKLTTDPAVEIDLDNMYMEWAYNKNTNDADDDGWEVVEDNAVYEANTYYGVIVDFELPDNVAIVEEGFEVFVNGTKLNEGDFFAMNGTDNENGFVMLLKIYDKLTENEDPSDPETPDDKEYEIIRGANGEWKDNGKDGLTFASDAEFVDFVSVKVDGVEVDKKNYSAKEGSTIVTLSVDFLKTLKDGKHTLDIVSKDGKASTEFTITHVHAPVKVEEKKATCTDKGCKEHYACDCGKLFEDEKAEKEIADKSTLEIKAVGHKASTKWSSDKKSHWHKCTVCGEVADEKENHDFDDAGKICEICKYDVDKPQTGDDFNVAAVVAIMALSFAGILGVVGYYFYDKKRKI